MKKNPVCDACISIVILSAGAALIAYPKEISAAVRQSLSLCANTLIPTLFPFFVLSSMTTKLELFRPLERILAPLFKHIFHLPESCSSALVLGMIGGYPTGAKTAISLYQDGLCSREEAQRLLGFCNNCGPAFLFGAVGCGIFGNTHHALLLTSVHYAAAFLSGFILNRRECYSGGPHPNYSVKQIPLSAIFVDSVTGSLQIILNLCSFILCFGAISELLTLSRLPAKTVALLFPFLSAQAGEAFLLGLLEMTHGIFALPDNSAALRLILTSALVGWGGLSVHCQVLYLLRDTDLSPTNYIIGKGVHAALSALLMWSVLYGINLSCLIAGGTLLLLPCRRKKQWKTRKKYCIM